MYQVYQIVVPAVSVIALLYAISLYRRGKKTIREVVVWFIFWGLIAYFAMNPTKLEFLAKITGIQDSIKALVLISVTILFVITLKLVLITEKIRQDVTSLVRQNTLEDFSKEYDHD